MSRCRSKVEKKVLEDVKKVSTKVTSKIISSSSLGLVSSGKRWLDSVQTGEVAASEYGHLKILKITDLA